MNKLTYDPFIFAVRDIPSAMNIILTPEGTTTEERWRKETPYISELIGRAMKISPRSVILDYGCGIGRIAKELLALHGCRVVGVDISPNMRALSVGYVQSERFLACSPEMLDGLIDSGVAFDGAISIWVLQHCLDPATDIDRIHRALKPKSDLFIVNNIHRAVPTKERGWVNDQIDIKSMLSRQFSLREEGPLAQGAVADSLIDATFWAHLKRR